MTHEKVLAALAECAERIRAAGVTEAKRLPEGAFFGGQCQPALAHCLALCEEAMTWTEERKEKAMRWLAWVQGVLWTIVPVDIATLKQMNKP